MTTQRVERKSSLGSPRVEQSPSELVRKERKSSLGSPRVEQVPREPTQGTKSLNVRGSSSSPDFGKKIDEHRKLVEQLKKLSVENITCAVAILQSFLDPKILTKLKIEAITSPNSEVMAVAQNEDALQNLLSRKVEERVEDSRVVIKELDAFCTRIVENKKPSAYDTPFLYQVWSGEMYGDTKYGGLKKLLEDVRVINAKLKELNKTPSVTSVMG